MILAPLALAIIIVVAFMMWITGDGGPLFFGHRRIGMHGKVFRCWKVRTMVVDAELRLRDHLASDSGAAREWARDHKLSDDPRITHLGCFLRRTSLDELPQLWNVFKGDMSLVGPRPIVRTEMHKYGSHRAVYASVRPGVTGLWQISGRNDITYAERVRFDVDYVKKMSLWTDLKIIAGTFNAVLDRTGR